MTTFIHDGDAIDYTPTADVAAGDVVVQADLVGVAKLDILANTLGSLSVVGVFDFPKATGAGTALATGTTVYWDDAANVATSTAAGNKQIGKVVKGASDGDAVVRVRMNQ